MKTKVFSIICALALCSCNKSNGDMTSTTNSEENTDFRAEGYVATTIIYDKTASSPCDYLLEAKGGEILEAMDLPEEFKKDGVKLWVKYIPQRRRSQCGTAQPIGIERVVRR